MITLKSHTPAMLLAVMILLSACKKDEKESPQPVVPDVEVLGATVYADGGVTLSAKINKVPTDVSEYGFILSKDSTMTQGRIFLRMSTPPVAGEFKKDYNGVLEKDIKYFFTAYVLASNMNHTLYNAKSFASKGAKVVKVDSIYPSKALLGDTLTVKGKYFVNRIINIKFDNQISATFIKNDSTILCVVPLNLTKANPYIILTSDVQTDTIKKDFSLHAPVIKDFNALGSFRDTVTITGDYFNRITGGNVVSFGAVNATVVAVSRHQLKVLVPDNIEKSSTNITVRAQHQNTVSDKPFIIRRPELHVVPASGAVNSQVTIQGKNFHPIGSKNILTFEDNPTVITSANVDRLSVTIPNAPYPKRKATVKLKLLDYEISFPIDVQLTDKWIMVSNKIPFNDYMPVGAFTIEGISYVISTSKEFLFDNKTYVWKFNPSSYAWQKIEIPFVFTRQAVVTVAANRAYVYISTESGNFWEYNPAINVWTKKADYPGPARSGGAIFAGSGAIFTGFGGSAIPFDNKTDNTIMKYDISSDSWKKVSDYPTEFGNEARIRPSTFVMNNIMYIACGATSTGAVQVHSFNTANFNWTKVKNFPDARGETTAFVYGNSGFVATGTSLTGRGSTECFKYTPASDTWLILKDHIGPEVHSRRIEGGYSFVNNGKAYVGGASSSSHSFELYEADSGEL